MGFGGIGSGAGSGGLWAESFSVALSNEPLGLIFEFQRKKGY